ncbi:MAG: hypothetical protein ACT4QC_08160 [Planctomycetaceae bacterium]
MTAVLRNITTLCDEILVLDALMFLAACLCSYWALHHRFQKRYRTLRWAVDTLLIGGIMMMVVVCGMIAWTISEEPAARRLHHSQATTHPTQPVDRHGAD